MATLTGPQAITIGAQSLTLDKAWVPKYHNELKKGNTIVVRDQMETEGYAVLRVSHQVKSGIRGHVVSLEVEGIRDNGSSVFENRLVKAQMVLTCEDGIALETTLLTNVTNALCAYIPTVMADIMASRTD